MVKRILNSSGMYLLISILFAMGAIGKTVSKDPLVLDLQWICAIVFASIGLWQSKRKRKPVDEEAGKESSAP
jgi:hypothetical protein